MDLENNLREILKSIDGDIDVEALNRDSRLIEDIGMSSVSLLYMAVALEDEFGIDFTAKDLSEFRTVGDVIAEIEKEKK